MKKIKQYIVFFTLLIMMLIACNKQDIKDESSQQASETTEGQATESEIWGTKGPNGHDPTPYTEVELTSEQKSQVKTQELKIAVLMHTSSDFTNSVIAGISDTAKALGAQVVLVSDAEFDANKQKTDIENALILGPDIIITLILDNISGAAALRPAIEKGVKISLLSNLPQGFVAGEDYASIVTDDLFGMGQSIAELINEELRGKGKVGLMYHDANYYVTNQRDTAIRSVLQRNFPGIEIVANQGIANPDDGEIIASAILTQNPSLDAIYAPWDSIAEGVLAAARSAARKDLKVFSMDLGATTVLDMAKGGNMAGIVADLPYELGVTLTNAAVLSKLGSDVPPFITVPAIKVTKVNLEQGWKKSLRRALPPEVKAILQSKT